jgi:DNA-binding transcriptional ArsR family regulator
MGQFIEELPDYAHMIGYDKLAEEVKLGRPKGKANGKYKPAKGSAPEAILKLLGKKPLLPIETIRALARRFKERAVSTAIYGLKNKGLVSKQKDGRYAVTH